MCGRFVRYRASREVAAQLNIEDVTCELEPSYNVAPRQPVAVVMEDGRRKLATMQWGLIPHWARDDRIANKLINARSETIAEKPSFRAAFRSRRCLIVADGFYEWQAGPDGKVPMYIRFEDEQSFCMAGIYERSRDSEGNERVTCAIVTTEANAFMRDIHHRMPVIIDRGNYDQWLSNDTPVEELHDLMQSRELQPMKADAVSRNVNSPAHNGAECIEPQ